MNYDFDSYLMYEITPMSLYTVKVKVILTLPVQPSLLDTAAQTVFRRFPYFSRSVKIDEHGAYVLQPSTEPIAVMEEGTPLTLGSSVTNGLFFAITYKENVVYFNFAHNFCGGCGAMFWIKSTLWQYLSYTGHIVSSEGILTPYLSLQPGEAIIPDPDSFPDEVTIGEYKGGDSFIPMQDYITYFTNPSQGGQVFYPITIEKNQFMKYARENDGSPNSILCAAMFRMCSRVFPDAPQLSGGIVCNYRADVSCPETYRDLVRLLHIKYRPDMKDWPMEKLSTVTRGSMYLQMQPEISRKYYKNYVAFREEIDKMPDRNAKSAYALANSPLRNGAKDTFQISYVGNLSLGELSDYIKGIYTITEGHLMLEVNATEDLFCISFQVLNHDRHYLQEFLKVLEEENISYQAGEMEESNLPQICLAEEG